MYINKESFFNLAFLLNVLIALYPISYAFGNFAINLNTFFIILVGIFYLDFKSLSLKKNKIIFLFFFYIILITFYNFITSEYHFFFQDNNLIKSLLLLRYLLIFLIVEELVKKKLFNFYYFFSSSIFVTTFLCIDLLIQFYFGKDVFGYETIDRFRLSGFFGEEQIAGAYLRIFSIFSVSFIFIFFYEKKFNQNYFRIFFIAYFILTIVCLGLTGSRMAFILFLLSILFLFLFKKNFFYFNLTIITVTIFTILVLYSFNYRFKNNTDNFIFWSKEIIPGITLMFNDINFVSQSTHLKNFKYGILTWKENLLFGNGLRSSRDNCRKNSLARSYQKKGFVICNNHPHNYYIEILADTGIVGLTLFLVLFFKRIFIFFKEFVKINNLTPKNYFICFSSMSILVAELFPLKTSGSFFSTSNATIIFIILALVSKKLLKNNVK